MSYSLYLHQSIVASSIRWMEAKAVQSLPERERERDEEVTLMSTTIGGGVGSGDW